MFPHKLIVFVNIFLFFMMTQSGFAVMTAQTALTVINVTKWGAYGSPPQVIDYAVTVELSDMYYGKGVISWSVDPDCAWTPVSTGLAQRIWKIETSDLGKTYYAIGWDFLHQCSTVHSRARNVPTGTRGTMFSTLCDTNPSNCNGYERTNIMFWP